MTGTIPEADANELDQQEGIDNSTDTSQEEGQPQETQKEAKLTPEQIRAIAREEATRIAQSQVAKGENRIQAYIQQQVNALKATQRYSGMSDQQIEAAAQKIAVEAYTNPQITGAGQPQQQPNLQETEMHPTVEAAIALMEARGTVVEEGDPEFDQYIKPLLATGSYRTLIQATKDAMTAKEQRQQSRKSKAAVRTPGGDGGKTETDSTDISNITDSKELYRLGSLQMQQGGGRKK